MTSFLEPPKLMYTCTFYHKNLQDYFDDCADFPKRENLRYLRSIANIGHAEARVENTHSGKKTHISVNMGDNQNL